MRNPPWGAAVQTVKKLHSCLIARVGATIGRPRTPAAMASPPGRIWNPPLRRRGRACPARNLPRKRAPTYSRGRGMPRPYKTTRKRVVIQSSAVHGRFVGEGLDPPGALMVPQAPAERSRPLPTMLPVGAGHARPGTFPINERPRIAAGGACPAPTDRPGNGWSSNHLPLLLSFTIYSKLHNSS